LAPREGSVTQHSSVTTSARGNVAPGKGKEETTPVGLTRILLGQKMKKIHAVDSVATNGRWRFKATISF
jgi:hypothetical protein